MREVKVPLPYFDKRERAIINEIKKAGGDIFRTKLRSSIGGSNTTFARKIASLKKKGIIEEYKRSDGRLKTAYRFTEHATSMFNLEGALRMEKWFSASQKIELFPELEQVAQTLLGNDFSIYRMLGIKPQHIFLETLLATSKPPGLKEEEVREILSMCNAFFQNIVTGRVHPKLREQAEGYIVFHYRLERQKEEFQRLLSQHLLDYVTATDPLIQHEASSKLVELAIQHPDLPPMMTMAAANIARGLGLKTELRDLLRKYKAYNKKEEPFQLTRIQLMISTLNIFKKLYDSRRKRGSS